MLIGPFLMVSLYVVCRDNAPLPLYEDNPLPLKILLGSVLLFCTIWVGNPALALVSGIGIAVTSNVSAGKSINVVGRYSLQTAIVLLGLKLNAGQIAEIAQDYSLLATAYVVLTLFAGLVLGWVLNSSKQANCLISSGTAICGGTAVATLSPVIGAKSEETAIALALIFLLNAVALLTFPWIGEHLQMTQQQFGIWVALAVHDTSSVVATSTIFGDEAAQLATTVKLGRTLWLIPLVMLFAFVRNGRFTLAGVPLFVVLFLIAACLNSLVVVPDIILSSADFLSSTLLVLALFCIGCGISRDTLRQIRGAPVVHAIGLWLMVVPITLFMVLRLV